MSGNPEKRRRGGQPTDMAVVVARVAAARALMPRASVRSMAREAQVGRVAIREALAALKAASEWAYECQGDLRDGPCLVDADEPKRSTR